MRSTAISCGPHLNCYAGQLDLSMELRKLTSTASLSSYRRSCSERLRTSLTSIRRSVWDLASTSVLIEYRKYLHAYYICLYLS